MTLEELIQRCAASRQERRERYRYLRTWYLRGTDSQGPQARYNRLESHIDLLTSYLYAPEGTRFSLTLPPETRAQWQPHLEIARDDFVRRWRDTGADVRFAQYVEWAHVYSTVLCKVLPGPRIAYVDPGAFGVLREDLNSLDDQEAFVHWFVLTLSEVEALIPQDHPQRAQVLDLARARAVPGEQAGTGGPLPKIVQDIVVTGVGSTIQGVVSFANLGSEVPQVEEPLVELAEVWQQRDYRLGGQPFRDWHVTTAIEGLPILERRNPVLPWQPEGDWPAEQPFVGITPKPVMDYFWGRSELAPLLQLQEWRESRMREIDEFLRRQLDPSGLVSGVPMTDEKLKTLRTPGGWVSSPNPGARLAPLVPQMPPQAFDMVGQIDQMFNEAAGLPNILQGLTDQMRAGNQITAAANIAVGRIRKRALIIEDALEVLATRMFHVTQRHDTTKFQTPAGEAFVLSQLPSSVVVTVSAHSSSPVYAEQTAEKAALLLKAGAIDLPDFVELLGPPMSEELKLKARVLQQGQAEAAAKKMEIEEIKARRPARR